MNLKQELAKKIVNYSLRIKPKDIVWLEYSYIDDEMLECLISEISKAGGIPLLKNYDPKHTKYLLKYSGQDAIETLARYDVEQMRDADAVILIKGTKNKFELSDIPQSTLNMYSKCYSKPVHNDIRINKRWVLLRYPTESFAQDSHMSIDEFTKFYFNVCLLDYSKMGEHMDPLKALMEKTDKVRIVAMDTDLEFSIKGIPAVKCVADCNIPDGELYTAPVKDSINGKIFFNVPITVDGIHYEGLHLEFKDGKVIKCSSPEFDKVLDTDSGSRYVGEFSFGLNPYIVKPIDDILFDEKMAYSIHMAMGNSYDDAPNGNKSAIHIDLIHSHDTKYGGGKIYFDGKLIRENGLFTLDELVGLNPSNLI